jgi:hypothetical protein
MAIRQAFFEKKKQKIFALWHRQPFSASHLSADRLNTTSSEFLL